MIIGHRHILWGFILLLVFCFNMEVYAGTNPVLVYNSQKSESHPSIKAAIEAAEPFDTIGVPPAIYAEGNILINKSLVLIGHRYPVLDGESKHEVFTIIAPHVTIKGFKIINTGRSSMEDKAAIKCHDAHHVEIEDNILENTFFGIHLSNTHFARIACNRLKSSAQHEYEFGNGIHLWKCNHARIEGNEIQGHRDGIYLEFVTQSEMAENYSIYNQRYGLHFMFSHNNSYFHNTFRQNGAGVAVMYTQNVIMKYNVFEDNWGSSSYGMLLKDIRDSEVSHNQFSRNTTGIYMEGSSRTLFHHNIFHRNGHAIKLMASCDDNVFTLNNFSGNTFDVSTNGITVLNELKLNYWDKYEGYDMNRDGIGDIPYRPVSIFAMIVEQVPPAVMLWRSFLVYLLDRAERVIPAATPENLKDDQPKMRPNVIHI